LNIIKQSRTLNPVDNLWPDICYITCSETTQHNSRCQMADFYCGIRAEYATVDLIMQPT